MRNIIDWFAGLKKKQLILIRTGCGIVVLILVYVAFMTDVKFGSIDPDGFTPAAFFYIWLAVMAGGGLIYLEWERSSRKGR